jgi:hypothetical protein
MNKTQIMDKKQELQNELIRIKIQIEQKERELSVLLEARKSVESELIFLESKEKETE